MENEVWRDMPHYEGRYLISNQGRVFSLLTKRYIKLSIDSFGYVGVSLFDKNKKKVREKVHRLVAMAFIPNPDNLPCVGHINEIKTDNRVENLMWCTHKENNNWGTHNQKVSEALINNKYLSVRVGQIKDGVLIAEYPSAKEAERQTGVNNSNIIRVCKGKRNSAGGYQWIYLEDKK